MAATALSTTSTGAPPPPASLPVRPEILAPAGDWECVHAAVENGADAVYFGLDRFNARMRAKNFTVADLPELMAYLHRRGVRGYVTFNTLAFADEIPEAEAYLRGIIAAGVDAAVVQDVGICRLIRALSSDFPIHCSTQMTITSAAGVAFAQELGASLVVLARENSLKDIAAIQAAQGTFGQEPGVGPSTFDLRPSAPDPRHSTLDTRHSTLVPRPSTPLPLEVFVHGALCVAYSGQCLTSEALGGRSANRGECSQACRMPYELLADGKVVDLGHRHYLLSPQDLASLDVLPDLIRLGVASFKIEGRLKSPEYVAAITRVYRQAVDRVMEEIGRNGDSAGKNPASPGVAEASVLAELHREHDYTMEMAFSRGLYSGWFRGTNNQELVHANFGTKRGVYLGDVTRMGADLVVVRLAAPLKPGDGIVFDAGCPEEKEEGGRVYQVEPDGAGTVLRFGTGDIDFRRVHSGDRLWKTSDPALEKRIRQTFEGGKIRFRRPVRIEAQGRAGTPLTVTMDDRVGHAVTAASAVPLEKARTQPLTADRLREQLGRLGGTPFRLGEFVSRVEGEVMLSLSELNRLRRTLVAELDQRRAQPLRWSLTAAPAESDLGAMDSAAGTPAPASPGAPELIVLIRRPDQLEAAWSAGARTIYCEFEDPKRYRDAVRRFRELQTADPASAGPMETNQGLARDIQTNPVGAVGACLPVRRVRWAHRKQAQGPEPFRQAQGPERVEGLVEGQAIPPLHPPSPSLRRTGREHLSAVASSEGGSSLLQLHESAQGLQQGSPPSTIWVALPRIFKPGEEWVLQQALSSGADGYLARNYDHLAFFRGQRMRGDYSLNVANPLAAAYFLKRYGLERVTASYDLNVAQLEALLHSAPPAWFEITIHQHMPMFHMEHCVACAFLTTGRDYRDCGRPCDRLDIRLRDRIGAGFPVKADAGCRNTVFNNRAQTGAEYVSRVLALGARAFRVEFLDENPEELQRTVRSYRQLLRGEITGAALWREFKLINQLGVTRGQMEAAAPVLTRKS